MARSLGSIFSGRKTASAEGVRPPQPAKALMRVLEPRVLLDAAAVETALDIAGQAAHTQLADDYMANTRPTDTLIDETADDREIAVVETTEKAANEIVFIDASVEDRETLIASLSPGVAVHIIERESDGVQQIADVLAGAQNVDAVHIFSHGEAGRLLLGNAILDTDSIANAHAEALADIGAALSENADILLYGCTFGSGEDGLAAAKALATATGADVAASDDLTGAADQGGDWALEVRAGVVETASFTAPDWNGILAGYTLRATGEPTIFHLGGDSIGTPGTVAVWTDAAVRDPGNGDPLEYYDVRATLRAVSENGSATFETRSTNAAEDDFRVVLTNIGSQTGTVDGEPVYEPAFASLSWSIVETGTGIRAPFDAITLAVPDIDGLGGSPNTRDTVSFDTATLWNFTREATSTLDVTLDSRDATASGTIASTGDSNGTFAGYWGSEAELFVTYSTAGQVATFDLDGDGDSTFTNPIVTPTQFIDLGGAGTGGNDFSVIYVDGARPGENVDVPLSIAAVDMSIFDVNSTHLFNASITLTNARAGDILAVDQDVINGLGIFATITDNTGTSGEITIDLDGFATLGSYETAIRAITYANERANPNTIQRVVEVTISDGIVTSPVATTLISYGTPGQSPVTGANLYVGREDTTLTREAARGLIADDSDPQGNALTVVGAMDAGGNAITIGAAHTMPSGSVLTLAADGSFTLEPAANYAGVETVTYQVSDGSFSSQGFATFDVQPVVDAVTLNIDPPAGSTREDDPSAPITITAFSADLDGSEVQRIDAYAIPLDVVLTDGVNEFRSSVLGDAVDITSWNLSNIRVLPTANNDEDVVISFEVRNTESNGAASFATQDVTFEIDAVADEAIVTVYQGGGAIDATVALGNLIEAVLFDNDGSETITQFQISDIPAGADILLSGTPLAQVSATVTFTQADIPNLEFRPPVTGASVVYTMQVAVTTTETGAENGVAQATAVRDNVGLIIDLNNDDDPVLALDDSAATAAGESVVIEVLRNDIVPDGGERVNAINGEVWAGVPIIMPGGQGTVEVTGQGDLKFNAAADFAGAFTFTYELIDIDGSTDTANVRIDVLPSWVLAGDTSAVEGTDASYTITLDGGLEQGRSASVTLLDTSITASNADRGDLWTAIEDAITAAGPDSGFTFASGQLTYTAPPKNFTSAVGTGPAFVDISSIGTALNHASNSVSRVPLSFDFNFYDSTYDEIFVSTDGFITFGTGAIGSANTALDGTALGGRAIIAPFWDDLTTGPGDVHTFVSGGIIGERTFTVQWTGVGNANDSGTATFQVILSEADGSIAFVYDDVTFAGIADGGATATIGVQGNATIFDAYSFDSATVADGGSIVFTRGSDPAPSLTFAIEIIDDTSFEEEEVFRIELNTSSNAAIGQAQVSTEIAVSDNRAPIAFDDNVTIDDNESFVINVLTNPAGEDIDFDGHTLTLTSLDGVLASDTPQTITLASGAQVTFQNNGEVSYDPGDLFAYLQAGQQAFDTFDYSISDGFGGTASAPVNVTLTGRNQVSFVDADGSLTTGRDLDVQYTETDNDVSIVAADAVIIDPDNATLDRLEIELGGFQQASFERLTFDSTVVIFGTASSQTVTTATGTLTIAYDGATTIEITHSDAAGIPFAEIETLLRATTYDNTSAVDSRGLRTITYIAYDSATSGGEVSVTNLQVAGDNKAPIAGDDGVGTPFSTVEENALIINETTLLANDSDDDGDPISISSVDGGANGVAEIVGDGTIRYTPNVDFAGATSFTYTISDGLGGLSTASVFVNVSNVNDAPTLDFDTTSPNAVTLAYTENDGPLAFFGANALLNDVDSPTLSTLIVSLPDAREGDRVTFTNVAGITLSANPSDALTGIDADGPISLQFSGTESLADYRTLLASIGFSSISERPSEADRTVELRASDGALFSVTETATIEVTAVNDVPVAADDVNLSVDEDTQLLVLPSVLLSNDTDADLDTLTVLSVQNPVNGTVQMLGSGEIAFDPTPDFFGAASFEYTVSDGNGGLATGTVNVTVDAVNDAPTLDIDPASLGTVSDYIEDDTGVFILSSTPDITDVDNTTLTSATVELTNGFVGDTILTIGLPPSLSATFSQPVPLAANGPLVLTITGNGSLTDYRSALGALRFASNSNNPDTTDRQITYVVNDGTEDSPVGTTTVTVTRTNDVPIAGNDSGITMDEDVARTFTAAELLANDSDPDFDTITISAITNSVGGVAVLNGDGSVTFTPDADYFGTASFDYEVRDPSDETDTARVTIDVRSVADKPSLTIDTSTIAEHVEDAGATTIITDPAITLTDVDSTELASATVTLTNARIGDVLAASGLPAGLNVSVAPAMPLLANGTATLTITGPASLADYATALGLVTFSVASDAPDETRRTFTITVSDGAETSDAVGVAVDVTASNDAPTAVDDGPFSVDEDTALTLPAAVLLTNDSDPDLENVTIVSVQNGVNGTVSMSGGTITFTPAVDYSGPASFEYTIEDGGGEQRVGTVSVIVSPLNDKTIIDLDTGAAASGTSTAYQEGDAPVQLMAAPLSLTDVDDTQLERMTVTLTNGSSGDQLQVGTLPPGISVNISPSGPLVSAQAITVTLTGSADLADYETALQAITYRSTSDNPATAVRTLLVTANDGDANSDAVAVSITVTRVNDDPVAAGDGPYTFDEDQTLSLPVGTLLLNDFDPDGEPVSVVSVQNPSGGTVDLTGGTITFTPTPDFFGAASFEYTIEDAAGATHTATVALNVTALNDKPVLDLDAAPGSITYTEGGSAAAIAGAAVTLSDVDDLTYASATVTLTNGQVGDRLVVGTLPGGLSVLVSPSNALLTAGTVTVTISGDASAADYQTALQAVGFMSVSNNPSGADRIVDVTVNDGETNSDVVTAIVAVDLVNDAPNARADGPFTLDEDTPLTIASGTLLLNDTDPEGAPLTIVSVQTALGGTAVLLGNGDVMFTPDANYFGPASFEYTVFDGTDGYTDTTVTLTVASLNDAPVIDGNGAAAGLDTALAYTENDAPLPLFGTDLTLSDVESTSLESATIVLSNGFAGDTIVDLGVAGAISVSTAPTGPLASNGTFTVTLTGTAPLADYEAALRALAFESTSDDIDATTRNISVTVNDGADDSVAAGVSIAITAVNDTPLALPDGPFDFDEDTLLVLQAADLLSNDSDPESTPLTVVGVSNALNGSVQLTGTTITFTPTPTYSGPASFDYTVEDAEGLSTTVTVTLSVTSVNDAPEIDLNGAALGVDFTVAYTENDLPIAISDPTMTLFDEDDGTLDGATIVLTNAFDGDDIAVSGATPGITVTRAPAAGLSPSGTITLTLSGTAPIADYRTALARVSYVSSADDIDTTTRAVTFQLDDGTDAGPLAIASIDVTALNDAPVATDDGSVTPLAMTEDVPFTFDPTANDSDADNDPLSVTAIDGMPITAGTPLPVAGGSVLLDADGRTLTFTPAPNSFAPVSFTYDVTDGTETRTATAYFAIASVNDAPVALDDGPVTLVEDTNILFNPVANNDSDVEGDPLTIRELAGQPIAPNGSILIPEGQLTLGADGRSVLFQPAQNVDGTVVVAYTVTDGANDATATLTFEITSEDDPLTLLPLAPVSLLDGQVVSFDMSAFVQDPDNDPVIYTATGLPAGLSIDPSTGEVSGTVSAAASQAGPYTVTFTADDQNGSMVSGDFTIDVTNTVPVGVPQILTLAEGTPFTLAVAAVVADTDGDVLVYTVTGLPEWAAFDAATGTISGTPPSDSSTAAAVLVTIAADDGEGGLASAVVTLAPQNVAPVAISSLADLTRDEGGVVAINLTAFFEDGGDDNDTLIYAVSGLPAGLTFDATTGRISGTLAEGSGRAAAYAIDVTVSDGQGGTLTERFNLNVAAPVDEPAPEPVPVDTVVVAPVSPVPQTDPDAPSVIGTVDNFQRDRAGTTFADFDTVATVRPVFGDIAEVGEGLTTLLTSVGVLPPALNEGTSGFISVRAALEGSEAGRGERDDAEAETNRQVAPGEEGTNAPVITSAESRLDKIHVDLVSKDGVIYMSMVDTFDPATDGAVTALALTGEKGAPLPGGVTMLNPRFASVTMPENGQPMVLEVRVTMSDDATLTKRVVLQPAAPVTGAGNGLRSGL